MLRKLFTVLAVTSLLTSLITSYANAALDDGYPEGAAAPGRTCSADAVGQKELSSFSGKNLSCILIFGIAKWWIDGDPLPAAETPAAKPTASAGPAPSAGPTAPASAGNQFVLEKGVKITLKKGSKLMKVGDVRPAQVLIPGTLKAKVAAPLLVALPGFTATPNDLLALVDLTAEAYKRGVVLALPSGSKNSGGLPFWNATGSCCDFEKSGVDDSKYLMDLVKQISAKVSIDSKRIYFFGHSNGGFMSYRMACKYPDRIAAIASLAGASYFKTTDCGAKSPVSVLQVHGTKDGTILYDGGQILGTSYPGAVASASQWATFNQCTQSAVARSTKLDLEPNIAGDETSIKAWTNCQNSSEVELWTMENATHIPTLVSTFATKIWEFFAAHPKP